MTKSRWSDDASMSKELDRMYRFIGEYVISFQWLENQIDQMFLLGEIGSKREEVQLLLARQSNKMKVVEFSKLVKLGKKFKKNEVDGWYNHFSGVIERLQAERSRRNSIVHAQFLFDFVCIQLRHAATNIHIDAK